IMAGPTYLVRENTIPVTGHPEIQLISNIWQRPPFPLFYTPHMRLPWKWFSITAANFLKNIMELPLLTLEVRCTVILWYAIKFPVYFVITANLPDLKIF